MLRLGRQSGCERTPALALQIHWPRGFAVIPIITLMYLAHNCAVIWMLSTREGKRSYSKQQVVEVGQLVFLARVPQSDAICFQMLLKNIDRNFPTPHSLISYFPQCGYEIYKHT